MSCDGFFARSDDGFEPKRLSIRVFPGRGFPYRELSSRKPAKVKAHIAFIGCEWMCDPGFLWVHMQSHVSSPVGALLFCLLELFQVGMPHDEILGRPYQNGWFHLFAVAFAQSGFFHALKSDVGKQRADRSSLRRSGFGGSEDPIFEHTRLEPALDGMFPGGRGVPFVQKGILVDVIKARFQVGIYHKFRFVSKTIEDSSDSIVG
jgi:hypothetical protein